MGRVVFPTNEQRECSWSRRGKPPVSAMAPPGGRRGQQGSGLREKQRVSRS